MGDVPLQSNADTAPFLVCGLGGLGQHCVIVLKEFGVRVNAIDIVDKDYWEIPDLPEFDQLLIGDCRQPKILKQVNIQQCRAVLLVTSDERTNIEAAFAARALNPQVRLIIRSGQQNLNQLLRQRLGNFAAFEATQLSAAAFALGALDSETRGFFHLEAQLLRVARVQVDANHRWCDRRKLYELDHASRLILSHTRKEMPPAKEFYQWEPEATVREGDALVFIEAVSGAIAFGRPAPRSRWRSLAKKLRWQTLKPRLLQFWQDIQQTPTQQVALLCGITVLSLFLIGAILYKLQYPDLSLQDSLNITFVLILGGYDNVFGHLKLPFIMPWWLHLLSISLTIVGTVFVGIFYALLTERILVSRFQLLKRRPPLPKQGHVVLVGFGRVGQRVARFLQELKQPLVGVHTASLEPGVLPQLPLCVGNLTAALSRANLTTAKSVIAVTDDEVTNLEIGLMAQAANPDISLVIRTFDPVFSENVARLLPDARVLGAYALAAEAFAAAAFGENVLSLFRLNHQTMLVTEYRVEADDTLNGLLLGEVAYGYGVIPILHQTDESGLAKLMPAHDRRLQVDDRLIILSTLEGLQEIERGTMGLRNWLVRVEQALSQEAIFEGSVTLARMSGCDIGVARALMRQLPKTLEFPLYKHQAQRLVRDLKKVQVVAHLLPRSPEAGSL